jgi:Zn-dependent protease with chaperone function
MMDAQPSEPTTTSYFDGSGARRQAVSLQLREEGIAILSDGREITLWRFADLRDADSPEGILRVGAAGAPELARLEIHDAATREAILARCPDLTKRKRGGEAGAGRIVLWSLGAALSVVLTVVYLVPLVADRLAPFIPFAMERRLGEAVDMQVRRLFGAEPCDASPGKAALARLAAELMTAADLPLPVTVAVLPSETVNAVALPGGHVYVFAGLLKAADNPDELAGVISHELGHVAARDGLRKLLETGGSSFLLGLLFGDITGSGAIIFGAQTLVDSRYSRDAEASADSFGARLMLRLGRSPKPLGLFLNRIDTGGGKALAFISSHPVTAERMHALEAADKPVTGAPLLDAENWTALKEICGTAAPPNPGDSTGAD